MKALDAVRETLAGTSLAKLEAQERSLRARLVTQETEEAGLVAETAGAHEAMVERLANDPDVDAGKLRAETQAATARLDAVRAVISATREALARVTAALEEKRAARVTERRRELLAKAEAEAKTAAGEAVALFEKLVPILSRGNIADARAQHLALSLGANGPDHALFRFSPSGISDNVADGLRGRDGGIAFERVDFPVHSFNPYAVAADIEREATKN